MNTGLKALIKAAVDLFAAGKAAVEQENFVTSIMPKLYAVAMDVPAIAQNWSTMDDELKALLASSEADADLVAYVLSSFAGVTTDEKAKKVLGAVLVAVTHVVQDTVSIHKAITEA